MIKYLFALVALIASVPVTVIAFALTKAAYEDWKLDYLDRKMVAVAVVGSLWIVPAYTATYALFVLFGGEA